MSASSASTGISTMLFISYVRKYRVEIAFVTLVAALGYIYFVIYLTADRVAWYDEMFNQAHVWFDLLMKALLKLQKA